MTQLPSKAGAGGALNFSPEECVPGHQVSCVIGTRLPATVRSTCTAVQGFLRGSSFPS